MAKVDLDGANYKTEYNTKPYNPMASLKQLNVK